MIVNLSYSDLDPRSPLLVQVHPGGNVIYVYEPHVPLGPQLREGLTTVRAAIDAILEAEVTP